MYDYTEQNFSDIRIRRETANWLNVDVTPGTRGDVYLSATLVIGGGNEEVKYQFREPL